MKVDYNMSDPVTVEFDEGRTVDIDKVWIEVDCDCADAPHLQVLSEWL